ncbi:hypothetical protein HNP33_004089 [Comamonas odontotermitis]|uniref:Uncharacterized protein n=1 Tax=Comamonas odontotermitis TaxID=379895 RepID=A0ABR6RLD8_9BURK|nr:hypothetical protein [Comamonas odontotermitis]
MAVGQRSKKDAPAAMFMAISRSSKMVMVGFIQNLIWCVDRELSQSTHDPIRRLPSGCSSVFPFTMKPEQKFTGSIQLLRRGRLAGGAQPGAPSRGRQALSYVCTACDFAWRGLTWPGLAWLGLAWLGLTWPGLTWPGALSPSQIYDVLGGVCGSSSCCVRAMTARLCRGFGPCDPRCRLRAYWRLAAWSAADRRRGRRPVSGCRSLA